MKEDEQYIQKYSVIVKAGNMSRGYVVYAGSAFDMMKKLMEHVTTSPVKTSGHPFVWRLVFRKIRLRWS